MGVCDGTGAAAGGALLGVEPTPIGGGAATSGAGRNGLTRVSGAAGAGEAAEVVPFVGAGGLALAGAAEGVDESAAGVSATALETRRGSPTSATANRIRRIMRKIQPR